MGLFDKKYCDICGEKIGLLGNRKLDDGNMCKSCAELLSPFATDRRKTSVSEIKEHLAYREENKNEVASFNVTRSIGNKTKVLLDEDAGKFIVTSVDRWKNENPDVIKFSQVTGCNTEIRESRKEIKGRDKDGNEFSLSPPQYDVDYDFYTTIGVNSPWFSQIGLKINSNRVDQRGSVEYREMDRQAQEIREALTQVRQEVRDSVIDAKAPKKAQLCPQCGATTIPNANGCCEFCGGPM